MSEKILNLLHLVCEEYPHLRVSQVVSNACIAGGWGRDDVFYCPDDILYKGLEIWYNRACVCKPQ